MAGAAVLSITCFVKTQSTTYYSIRMAVQDTSLLQAALIGYQMEADKVANAIAGLQKRLGNRSGNATTPVASNGRRKRHKISAEGRARIAAAQRKRWAGARRKPKTRTAGG